MKTKCMLIVVVLTGSILSFHPEILWAGGVGGLFFRIGDLRMTCEGKALQDYDRCLEKKEKLCGEELQSTFTLSRAPYLVCPSDEEITDLPCEERYNRTFETCTCRQEADEHYEDCMQHGPAWVCRSLRGLEYRDCSKFSEF